MTQTVSVERKGAIALVRFDRSGQANALTFDIMRALTAAARGFEEDPQTAVVILTGADRVFSGGMDLKAADWDRLPSLSLDERREFARLGPRLARAWMGVEPVTIAAIEGPCYAGGLALAAMCDFRVAGRSARFAAPEVAVGLNMAWHSVPRLVRLVGVQATRQLLLLGATWDTAKAAGLGFLDEVCEDGSALVAAHRMAERVAARPQLATRLVKRAIETVQHGGDIAQSLADGDLQLVNWTSEAFANARSRLKGGKARSD
jgi:enoyl-CoA hydratase/carnithine racemase